jgi:hypothetical protein
MGLDMYLYRKTFVQNWDHHTPDERHKFFIEGPQAEYIKPERITYIVEQVAYWSKANQIHRWFIENVQGGKDDCGEYHVEPEKLQELLALCKQVLGTVETFEGDVSTGTSYYPDGRIVEHTQPGRVVAQAGIAASVLPTQAGFFFGGTEYDEWYMQQLEKTVEVLEPLLAEGGCGEFYYESSW